MFKIDAEEFDKLVENEFASNDELSYLMSQFKTDMPHCDDAFINSLIIKTFEVAYQNGFNAGIDLIVKRHSTDIFTGKLKTI